jgi:hypothetical protein
MVLVRPAFAAPQSPVALVSNLLYRLSACDAQAGRFPIGNPHAHPNPFPRQAGNTAIQQTWKSALREKTRRMPHLQSSIQELHSLSSPAKTAADLSAEIMA